MRVRKEPLIILSMCTVLFTGAFFEWTPIKQIMDWRAVTNTQVTNEIEVAGYEVVDHAGDNLPLLTIDMLKGKHFWNPQVAIWLEDSAGNHLETLLVTTSTAQGLFYGGRSANNFKESDEVKTQNEQPTRRVDALPYWSHKRGHRYPDGYFSPPPDDPLPDGITSATPKGNLYFKTSGVTAANLSAFRVVVEINVAFDENEYYSEYDFPEDSLYHGGTGLLGQPSLVYMATVNKRDRERYYVMEVAGHGHYSGVNGELYQDMETITTARYIAERIVVGVGEEWYEK